MNSRKTRPKAKVKFTKGKVVAGGQSGQTKPSLGKPIDTVEATLVSADSPPPSPVPPSSSLEDQGDSADTEQYDDYTQHAKQQTKRKLESITGRMYQVLNDFEDSHKNEELHSDLLTKERDNIQSIISDYQDTCYERKDLLISLAEWFDDDHIETMIKEIQEKRSSLSADPEQLRTSLLEGKQTSLKLKAVNERILSAENRGLNTEQLLREKEELERRLMTKIDLVDEMEGVHDKSSKAPPYKTVSSVVIDSWRYAAGEICNMLHHVRDSGADELQELDAKIQQLVATMNHQLQVIEELNTEIQNQKQAATFAEETTLKLSNDNSLLHEEVDTLRTQLLDAGHTISSLKADLHNMALKLELESKKVAPATKKKGTSNKSQSNSTPVKSGDVSKYEAAISDLNNEIVTFSAENEELKQTIENLKSDLEHLRDHSANFLQENEDLKQSMENLQRELDAVRAHSATYSQENEELRKNVQILQKELDEVRGRSETFSQENHNLKQTLEKLRRELDDARANFQFELESYKTKLARCQMLHSPTVRSAPVEEEQVYREPSSSGIVQDPPTEQSTVLEQKSQAESIPASSIPNPKTPPQSDTTTSTMEGERRENSGSSKEVRLLQIKLGNKDVQLKNAEEKVRKLRTQVTVLESELHNVRENVQQTGQQEMSESLWRQVSTSTTRKTSAGVETQVSTSKMTQSSMVRSKQKQRSFDNDNNNLGRNEQSVSQKTRAHLEHSEEKQRDSGSDTSTPGVHPVTEHIPKRPQVKMKETREQLTEKQVLSKETPNFWISVESQASKEKIFEMPEERSEEEKEVESLQLAVKLIDQVNEDKMPESVTADSQAFQNVQTKLQNMCQVVTSFLECSSNLVNDEADIMSSAMDSLISQLPDNVKKDVLTQTTKGQKNAKMVSDSREASRPERNELKEKVEKYTHLAIDALRAGEKALTTKITTQKRDLQTVMRAMAAHKQRNPIGFKFKAPDLKDMMLTGVGTQDDSSATRIPLNQHGQTQASGPSETLKLINDRQRQYPRPQENPNIYDEKTSGTFKGLGTGLFMRARQAPRGTPQMSLLGKGPLEVNANGRDVRSYLQINATSERGTPRGNGSQLQIISQKGKSLNTPLSKKKRPKLNNTFQFQPHLNGDSPFAVLKNVKTSSDSPFDVLTNAKPSHQTSRSQGYKKLPLKADLETKGTGHSDGIGKRNGPSNDKPLKLPPLTNF